MFLTAEFCNYVLIQGQSLKCSICNCSLNCKIFIKTIKIIKFDDNKVKKSKYNFSNDLLEIKRT